MWKKKLMQVWDKCVVLRKLLYRCNLLLDSRAGRTGDTGRGTCMKGNI